MVKLITADSYFELFPATINLIKDASSGLKDRNVIFCEAKISLMIERLLCAECGGTFNTEVYSFGKFLRDHKKVDKVLSKEGASMVVKKILSKVSLKCFKASYRSLSPALYDLIIQLKSAKVFPETLKDLSAVNNTVLKNKLEDVYTVYSEYEQFLLNAGYDDQSSLLNYLPDVIRDSEEIKNANVYIVGYSGFTAQARSVIEAIFKTAKSVTAVLTEGENKQVFVNETAQFIRDLSRRLNISIEEKTVKSAYATEGKLIIDGLFQPQRANKKAIKAEGGVYYLSAQNISDEAERVAEVIKTAVINGECRYRDVTIAVPDVNLYGDAIKSAFDLLEIPFYLDEKKRAESHPLISLILTYIDVLRKNFQRRTLIRFIKNPLFLEDKNLADAFENYLIKYNVNYGKIKEPFTFEVQNDYTLDDFNGIRERIVGIFSEFNVEKMLSTLSVKEKLEGFSARLKESGRAEESAVNEQIYELVIGVLGEMKGILAGVDMTLGEYKDVFLGGVSAMELSIIPQYNDAVFVGGFKECALGIAKKLFVMGLNSDVPQLKQDVAILSDGDIDALERVKVLVEPKIKIVNHRAKENLAMCLSAFSDGLYVSYPIATVDGKKNFKSEVISHLDKTFILKPFPKTQKYITEKQGLKTFAYQCGQFADCNLDDFSEASAYFNVIGEEKLNAFLDYANKEVKVRLEGNRPLIGKEISPTTIEDYYKCPYRSFLAHTLRLKKREDGMVDVLSVGNLMHEILNGYVKHLEEVCDENSSNALFDSVKQKILDREEYKKFLLDAETSATVKRVLNECKKYCYKTYKSFKNSKFNTRNSEAAFGNYEKAVYPAVPLLNGEVHIKGKIDRVDESEEYFRVIDYKTGSTDVTEKSFFAGIKLQLYLYALAVSAKYEKTTPKKPAGLYYLPISDSYKKHGDQEKPLAVGKTLGEEQAVIAQDGEFFDNGKSEFLPVSVDKDRRVKNAPDMDALQKYLNYAREVSNSAVERLKEGVIIKSPYEKACEKCDFKAICNNEEVKIRTLGAVNSQTIINATEEEK